jgi:hypothetical protein
MKWSPSLPVFGPLNRAGTKARGRGRIQRAIVKAFAFTGRPTLTTTELAGFSHAHLRLLRESGTNTQGRSTVAFTGCVHCSEYLQPTSEVAPKNFCITVSDVLWNHLFVRSLEIRLILWAFIGHLQDCEPTI